MLIRYVRKCGLSHWRTFVADIRYMISNQRMCYHANRDPEGVAMGRYDNA